MAASVHHEPTLENLVDNSLASMPVTNESDLLIKAKYAAKKIRILAEDVSKERGNGESVEDIYRIIGFNPRGFLNMYAHPITDAKIPIIVPYGTAHAEYKNIDPHRELKLDREYFAEKLRNLASGNDLENLRDGAASNDSLFSRLIDPIAEFKAYLDVCGWTMPVTFFGALTHPVDRSALEERKEVVKKEWGGLARKVLVGAAIATVAVAAVLGGFNYYNNNIKQSPDNQQPYTPSITESPTPTITQTPTPTLTSEPTPAPLPTPTPLLGYTMKDPGDASLEDIQSYAHTVLYNTANYKPGTKEFQDTMKLYNLMVGDVVNSNSVKEVHDKYVKVVRIFHECQYGPKSQAYWDKQDAATWADAEEMYNNKDKQEEADSWKYSLDSTLGVKCKTT